MNQHNLAEKQPPQATPSDVMTHVYDEEKGLPLVVEPADRNAPPRLADWLGQHKQTVLEWRTQYGVVLFRGFGVDSAQGFEDAALVVEPDLKDKYLGISPRKTLTRYVFTSAELPPHYPIPQHAEMSFYYDKAPKSLFFWCSQPSETGGCTPVTNLRKVYRELDPEVRARLEQKGVRHIRGYRGLKQKLKLDVFQFKRWSEVFDTEDKAEVEALCAETGDEVHWGKDDRLTLYSTHPAMRDHPVTGERSWYNHLQVMHLAATPHELARQGRLLRRPRLLFYAALLKTIATIKYLFIPTHKQTWHATYADGSEIPADDVRHACDVIWQNTAVFDWQKGDVMAIDNASVAHGRTPFTGDRLIGVAWA